MTAKWFAAPGLASWGLAIWLTIATPALAQPDQRAQQPDVGVITVGPQPVYSQQSYVGRIQAPQIVQLQARVTGFLEQQAFQDGDTVTQGQLLYVIEQPPYQAAVDQAQAGLQQAQAQARNATLTLARDTALLRTPAGQQSNVDASRATAGSDLAAIASAKAQLEMAEINLGYTEIRSPITGRIGATAVDVGNVVGPTSGVLATVVSQDPMYVTFALPVLDALKLRTAGGAAGFQGVDVILQLPDGSTYPHTGLIDFVNNEITQTTDTLNLRATIPNPPLPGMTPPQRALVSGEFVNIILRSRTPQQQITVPREAVITDQLGDYVLVLDKNGIVKRQAVTLGETTPDSAVILQGLASGDQVVVDGIQNVHPGVKATPHPAADAG
jgi:membrane fusion protein (multidrug efflux system)